MSYEMRFEPSAMREVRKLDEVTPKAIISEVGLLADNPRPDGCKKLTGESNLYRIRVLISNKSDTLPSFATRLH